MTLIKVNLADAFNSFLSYIAAANKQHIDPDVLDDMYQEKVDRLKYDMSMLTQLASEGMEEQLSPLLNTLLQEWALKEAIKLLLRYQNCMIDPSGLDLRRCFWDQLCREHQSLSSELLLELQRGQDKRARAQEERAQSWQAIFESQQRQQQEKNQQWFEREQRRFEQYQRENRDWANVAMVGAQQAQLGLKQWYDFAAGIHENATKLFATTEQRHAAIVEQAVHKANTKKWITRLMIIGLAFIGLVALFGGAFFALMHLY
jgi:hypothetical protein